MPVESQVISKAILDKSLGFEAVEPRKEVEFSNIFLFLETVKFDLKSNGVDAQDYIVKLPKFFLKNSVTNRQREYLDEKLGPYYAAKSVTLQKSVEKISIHESYEKLIFLPKLFADNSTPVMFSDLPFNQACGDWAGKQRLFWVRESMGVKLLTLAKALDKSGICMHFEDAFRPVGVQEGLFKRRVDWIMEQHKNWDYPAIMQEAMSKTAVTPRLASHKSGAAVDVTLRYASGKPMDIGNKYPEGGALVALECPFITKDQWYARQIFAGVFTMAGFTLYPGEDWHASFTDNLAGVNDGRLIPGYEAKYGPIKKIDFKTGEIIDTYKINELDLQFNSALDET